MSPLVVFDGPVSYPNRAVYDFFSEGSSPRILQALADYLKKNSARLSEVFIAFYMYNNRALHDTLQQVARGGCRVVVVSMPLEGYDPKNPRDLVDASTGAKVRKNVSKLDLATEIYNMAATSAITGFDLRVFPHMYVRSRRVKPFSRGTMPYSLHTKSLFLKYKDGSSQLGLTSSNLAVRDLCKFEVLVIQDASESAARSAQHFFNSLISLSFSVPDFKPGEDWRHFAIKASLSPGASGNFYIAPFYKDSPTIIEEKLIKMIRTAQRRVYISAEHLSAYEYNVQADGSHIHPSRRRGILGALIEAGTRGLDVQCISQTYVDQFGSAAINGTKTPEPANKHNFASFISSYKTSKAGAYFVNEKIHEKYLIVDDKVVVTTCNFTPTQFIFFDDVDIKAFDYDKSLSYSGIHSEVGQFLLIDDAAAVQQFVERFTSLSAQRGTLRAC